MKSIIESQIKGAFYGWSGDTLFCLTNGQYWIQAKYAYKYHYKYRPKVSISNSGSSYVMQVEGMEEAIAVRRVYDVIESRINGEFRGWGGDTIFPLKNGQVWKQSSYAYMYHYAYSPEVIIYENRLMVEGVDSTIPVERIK